MATLRPFAGWSICVLFGICLHAGGLTQWLDRPWLDWQFGVLRAYFPQPARNDVVLIGIDEEFLRSVPEPLALMHRRLARLFEAVAAGRPRATGLDIVLPDKSFSFLVPANEPNIDFDRELASGLLKLGAVAPLFIGEVWDNAHSQFRDVHPAFVAASGHWVSKRGLDGFDHRGSSLVCPDADGVVRLYPGKSCQPGGATRTFTGQMAALLTGNNSLDGYINYAVGAPFTYLPAQQIVAWHQAGSAENLTALSGKTVLIGVVLDQEDRLKLPVPLIQWEPNNRLAPGVALQAQMLRSVLNQGLVQVVPNGVVVVLILLAGCFWFGQRVRLKALGLLAFAVLLGACSLWTLNATLLLPISAILATGLLALLASSAATGRRHWLERKYLTQTFSGYVSPQVLKGILSGALAAGKAGQRLPVCVLFSDIRDFTTLSEDLPAERVVELLNTYFDRMARIVHLHGGLVDKFMGDGMMSLFGAPMPLVCAEQNALDAARDMLAALNELNVDFQANGLPVIQVGIGLHAGDAVIGHLGSQERHEYTAIGDAVNVAARVCGLPKSLGYPIVCTESVARAVGFPDFLVDAGEQPLKGHTDVHVYGWQP